MWSFSNLRSFKNCQRQWFFKHIYASWNATDLRRREVHRLSKLTGLKAWRGKIVDRVLSFDIIPAMRTGKPMTFESARELAYSMFERERRLGIESRPQSEIAKLTNNFFHGFLEVENGQPPSDADFNEAWNEIEEALRSFFASKSLPGFVGNATAVKTQNIVPFDCHGVSVTTMPDAVCFYRDRTPLIIDWKVQTNPIENHWLQLGTYGLALARCKPQRGWPVLPAELSPSNIKLAEVQLLTRRIRMHSVTDDEVEEIEELIAVSAAEMSLARRNLSPKELNPEMFLRAVSPAICQYCPFVKICWVREK
jgi:hypothetical protein